MSVASILGQEVKNMLIGAAFGLAVAALVIGIQNSLRNSNVYLLNQPVSAFPLTSPQCNKQVAVVQPTVDPGPNANIKLPNCPKNAWIEFVPGNNQDPATAAFSYLVESTQGPVPDQGTTTSTTTISKSTVTKCTYTPDFTGNQEWTCTTTNHAIL